MNASKTIKNPDVDAVFKSYPRKIRAKLVFLRKLILETADAIEEVGEIEETLKWGEPSYLTPKSKSGSTIRINRIKDQENQYAIFFKCTANLVPAFKEKFPRDFDFEGDRSIVFNIDDEIPKMKLRKCIALALTYHRNKKLDPSDRWKMVEKHCTVVSNSLNL